MTNDDSYLPDFSFNDLGNKTHNNSNVEIDSLKEQMMRLKGVTAKMRKCQQESEKREEMDTKIQEAGVEFNSRGDILVEFTNKEDEEMDVEQTNFLRKLDSDMDPSIPIKPSFEEFFKLDECAMKFYHYELEYKEATQSKKIQGQVKKTLFSESLYIEPKKFNNYFLNRGKAYLELMKDKMITVLSGLFLNIPWIRGGTQMCSSFEILTNALEDKEIASIWRVSDELLLSFLKSLGLDTKKLVEYFPVTALKVRPFGTKPHLSVIKKSLLKDLTEVDELKKEKILIRTQDFEIISRKLEHLLIFSLAKSEKYYKEDELDFIFFLFSFIILDKNFAKCNLKIETQLIFLKIFQAYENNSFWSKNKLDYLSQQIFKVFQTEKSRILNGQKTILDEASLATLNNVYHRFIHLIGYFRISRNTNVKRLASEIALKCVIDLFDTSNSDADQVPATGFPNQLKKLIAKAKLNCYQLFHDNSYSMFNIIEFLDVITCQLNTEILLKTEKIEFIEELRLLILETNRQVKDQIDCKGRAQVKVMISNFINKCDYYLSKLTVRRTIYGQSFMPVMGMFKTSQGSNTSMDDSTNGSQLANLV